MDLRAMALDGVAWRTAHNNIGIYAQAVHGDGGYEKRTERMDGWNECAIAHTKKLSAIRRWMSGLPPEHKTAIEDVLLAGLVDLTVNDSGITMSVDCSDLFFWGCSDSEDIEIAELPDLQRAIDDVAAAGASGGGDLLWVARKRAMRPQGAYYAAVSPALGKLFDSCGEFRKAELGNPVASSFEAGEEYREKKAVR